MDMRHKVSQLLSSSATVFFNSSISKLIANKSHDTVEKVALTNHETGEVTFMEIDEVIINHGYEREAELLKNSEVNIAMLEDFYVDGSSMSESSVAGIYAAGDILA